MRRAVRFLMILAMTLAVVPAPMLGTAQVSALPSPFIGWWEGTGRQTNPESEWPILVTLTEGGIGDVVGSVAYPTLACAGDLTLLAVSPDHSTIEVVERITEGTSNCIDHGRFVFATGGDGLTFSWSDPNGPSRAEGVLSFAPGTGPALPAGRLRVSVLTCPDTSETSWTVLLQTMIATPSRMCRAIIDEPRIFVIEDAAGERTTHQVDRMEIDLPFGSYTIIDEASGASFQFDLAPADNASLCDGAAGCAWAVLFLPDSPVAPPMAAPPLLPGIATVVIFAPGIDADLNPALLERSPYGQVAQTFGPILDRLGCEANIQTSPPRCAGGVTWIPFSYAGVDSSTGPRRYTGAATGQALRLSRNAMQDTVAYARALAPGARIVLVGHSLGGAVATFYGADDPLVQVVTLDSPVNGIWTENQAVLETYCTDSTGLLGGRTKFACPFAIKKEGLGSDIAGDLRREEVRARMGDARVVNFVNTVDLVVPSWYASHPRSAGGTVLLTNNCAGPFTGGELVEWGDAAKHACIIREAAPAVLDLIQRDQWPPAMNPDESVGMNVQLLWTAGSVQPASRAVVRVLWPGQREVPAARIELLSGSLQSTTMDIPWRDVLVEVELLGPAGNQMAVMCRGVLPGENQEITVSFSYPDATQGPCPIPSDPPTICAGQEPDPCLPWRGVAWEGFSISYPPNHTLYEVFQGEDTAAVTPRTGVRLYSDSCETAPAPECPALIFVLYPGQGLDLWDWIARNFPLLADVRNVRAVTVDGYPGMAFETSDPTSYSGEGTVYLVAVGDEMLRVSGFGENQMILEQIMNRLKVSQE